MALIPIKNAMFAEQRQRLTVELRKRLGDAAKGAVAVWQGAAEVARNAQDTAFAFRQDSYFYHLFGYESADCYGALDVASGEGHLFIPKLPESYAVWMGALLTCDQVKARTGVDHVHYCTQIGEVLTGQLNAGKVYVLKGVNSDSGISVKTADLSEAKLAAPIDDSTLLFDTHTQLRMYKTDLEVELLAQLNLVSSRAHVEVMKTVAKPGLNERHLEATFRHYVYMHGGCRELAYGAICAAGKGGAVLHYVDNDQELKENDMILMDMGGEYHCYASDITTCFPVGGKFLPHTRIIYEGVVAAHNAVVAAMKPGVKWPDMHLLALRVMADALRQLGVIAADATDEALEACELMANFMPHGLGHLIGIDVHDVGGYGVPDAPPRPTSQLTCKLRTARTLEERMFITVEPGCYFNAVLLEKAFQNPEQAKYLNEAKLRQPEIWNFGGVRIESNVVLTATGVRNLTSVPRTVDDVEQVMAGAKQWDFKN